MLPSEAKAIADFLTSDLESEMKTTLRVIESVPSDHLDYSPDAKSATGLGLVRHLPLFDSWLLNSIADGAFSRPPDQTDACGVMNPADAAACYVEKVTAALERVRALTPDQLAAEINFFGMMQLPAVHFIQLTIKHSVHHRGQLSTYLRSMGGKVPGIYGPSADK
jgi:uncharacterized damage-inducible protein DinB